MDLTQKKKPYLLEKANQRTFFFLNLKKTWDKDSCGFIQENICSPLCNRVAIGLVLTTIDSSYLYYKIPQQNMLNKFQPYKSQPNVLKCSMLEFLFLILGEHKLN